MRMGRGLMEGIGDSCLTVHSYASFSFFAFSCIVIVKFVCFSHESFKE